MTKKSMVQVAIGGKVLTMGGADDETHIQRIASCVNHVLQEFEDKDDTAVCRQI
ncbi:MAG: cell division protein ZapA [Eubacterium ramulus]